MRGARFVPTPVQSPRIPIWVAGTWPRKKPLARAARWNGYAPVKADLSVHRRGRGADGGRGRPGDGALDVVIPGNTRGRSAAERTSRVAPLAEAGATWWIESPLPWETTVEAARDRVRLGPPAP